MNEEPDVRGSNESKGTILSNKTSHDDPLFFHLELRYSGRPDCRLAAR
jgi:hypothetical protein